MVYTTIDNPVYPLGRFPTDLIGEDVYYKIVNHANTVVVARTATGVVEVGYGAYGILLSFDTVGNFVIIFDIDGTDYVASESINVTLNPDESRDNVKREFQQYNADKSVKKVRILKARDGDFNNPDIIKELTFEYNTDKTISVMKEEVL